jgi:mono/diheme cytochrome c family protein
MFFPSILLCLDAFPSKTAPVIVCPRKTLVNAPNFHHFIAMKSAVRPSSLHLTATSLAFAFLLAACGRSSGEVRDWQASDHDQPAGQQQGQVAARPNSSSSQAESDKSLVELAWMKNCASCHGMAGRGDGPQGPMVRAPDLTRAEWQSQVTDEQIAEVIRKGRNRMPAFEALPAQVVTGLVGRIRQNRTR